ncbi:hypothetical protein B566_EDAN013083 [Ephemera danica]|nr:hypothetical protein B566_EDAN013083 [Ephemera danica]
MSTSAGSSWVYQLLRIFVHLLAASQFAYSVYFDWMYVVIPTNDPVTRYGGKLRYLTFLDAIIQAAFFTLCFVNDIFGSNDLDPKPKPVLRKIKDYVQASLEFPLAMFVGITFWALYAVDRELVFPRILDDHFPNWLNHVLHTNIIGFAALEMALSGRKYPSRKKGLTGLLVFMLFYLSWVMVIFNQTGRWVYPVLAVLDWTQKCLFFGLLLMLVMGLYLAGEFLNNVIWGHHLKQIQSPAKKQSRKKTK